MATVRARGRLERAAGGRRSKRSRRGQDGVAAGVGAKAPTARCPSRWRAGCGVGACHASRDASVRAIVVPAPRADPGAPLQVDALPAALLALALSFVPWQELAASVSRVSRAMSKAGALRAQINATRRLDCSAADLPPTRLARLLSGLKAPLTHMRLVDATEAHLDVACASHSHGLRSLTLTVAEEDWRRNITLGGISRVVLRCRALRQMRILGTHDWDKASRPHPHLRPDLPVRDQGRVGGRSTSDDSDSDTDREEENGRANAEPLRCRPEPVRLEGVVFMPQHPLYFSEYGMARVAALARRARHLTVSCWGAALGASRVGRMRSVTLYVNSLDGAQRLWALFVRFPPCAPRIALVRIVCVLQPELLHVVAAMVARHSPFHGTACAPRIECVHVDALVAPGDAELAHHMRANPT
jgi:hypothetical protein